MPVAVYIHFPWCLQRCPYCDFATAAINPRDVPHAAYADGVIAELALRRGDFPAADGCTVFFGGGTPSLWEVPQLGRVLRSVTDTFGPAREVTVECNPTSLDAERAAALRAEGVDRVSVGVQSLRERHLKYLGRLHDAPSALRAVRDAVSAGGLRVTADLMFGMDGQSAQELLEDARALLEAGARHLSVYALTVEPATRFGELSRKGRLPRLPDDAVAQLFEAMDAEMRAAGLEHYEVSNYARPGERGMHNQLYWQGAPYVGLGAGAVGCFPATRGEAMRYRDVYDVPGYLAALRDGRLPPEERESLDAETLVREGLMLGLRTADGVDLAALAERTGLDPRKGRESAVAKQIARGNLDERDGHWRIPEARWLIADDIVAALF